MNIRKIDLLIHTEVMGKVPVKTPVPCPDGIQGCAVVHYSQSPQYSTNIQDAWLVLQKFKEYEINKMKREVLVRVWVGYSHYDVRGDFTEPMAICLAALKAKGVDVS